MEKMKQLFENAQLAARDLNLLETNKIDEILCAVADAT